VDNKIDINEPVVQDQPIAVKKIEVRRLKVKTQIKAAQSKSRYGRCRI